MLYFAQDVFIPVALALFLALLLTPAVDRLQRWHMRRGFAVAIVLLVVLRRAPRRSTPHGRPPRNGWHARRRPCDRSIRGCRPLREMFERVDDFAERAGRLTQGTTVVSGKPAIVTPVAGESTAFAMTKSFLEWLTVIPFTLFFLLGGPPLLARMGASLAGNEASAKALRLTEAIRSGSGPLLRHRRTDQRGPGDRHRTGDVCARHAERHPLGSARVRVQLRAVSRADRGIRHHRAGGAHRLSRTSGTRSRCRACSCVLHLIEGQLVQPLTVGRRCEVNALVILLGGVVRLWLLGHTRDVAGHARAGRAESGCAVPAHTGARAARLPLAQFAMASESLKRRALAPKESGAAKAAPDATPITTRKSA